jgi:hypothetical protein
MHTNPFYKVASHLVDDTYRFLSHKKRCSVLLEKDYFDGKQYTPDTFFDYSTQFFKNPELFFCKGTPGTESDISELVSKFDDDKIFSYPSPYKTQWIENNTAYFKEFSEDKKSDTILLFAPGWARPNLNAEMGICKALHNKGIDSCLMIKPFHQQRTPKGLYSGELFISGNIFLTVMNFRQFVSEIRFLITYYKKKYKYVGLIGMSSGGFQCGLAADVQEIDFYFPIITGAKLGSITWNGMLTKYVREDIEKKGVNENELNEAWGVSDQFYLGENCKATHIKQFISLYDQIVPTKYQYLLWEVYNKPELMEMHCAHTSVFFYFNRIVNEIATFIESRR